LNGFRSIFVLKFEKYSSIALLKWFIRSFVTVFTRIPVLRFSSTVIPVSKKFSGIANPGLNPDFQNLVEQKMFVFIKRNFLTFYFFKIQKSKNRSNISSFLISILVTYGTNNGFLAGESPMELFVFTDFLLNVADKSARNSWIWSFMVHWYRVHVQRICGPRNESENFLPSQIASKRVQLKVHCVNLRRKAVFLCFLEGWIAPISHKIHRQFYVRVRRR
jgi:hypothetical protein